MRQVKTRRITLPDGTKKRVYKYGDGAEERLEAEIRLLTRSIDGGPDETFHEFAKRVWYPSLEFVTPLTKRRYESAYKVHIRTFLGDVPMSAIKKPILHEFLYHIIRQGYTGYTTRFIIHLVSAICNLAIDHEILNVNPCVRLKNLPKKTPKRHRAMDLMTAQALLHGSERTVLSAPIFLAVVLGLRRGEISALKWTDLCRRTQTLAISRQRQAQKGKGVVETGPKSGSSRVIPIPRAVIEEIDRRGNLDSEWICTKNGKPWVPQTLYDEWMKVRDQYGLSEWTFHDLRRCFAGLMHLTGAKDLTVMEILGHTKVGQTHEYTSSTKDLIRDGLGRLMVEVGNR